MTNLNYYKILFNPRDRKIIFTDMLKALIGIILMALVILFYIYNGHDFFNYQHQSFPPKRLVGGVLFAMGAILFMINISKPILRKKAFIKVDNNGFEFRIKKVIHKEFSDAEFMRVMDFIDKDIDRMDTYYKYEWREISEILVDDIYCIFKLKRNNRTYKVAHTLNSEDANKFKEVIKIYNNQLNKVS